MTNKQVSTLEQVLVFFVVLIYSKCMNYQLHTNFDPPLYLLICERSAKLVAAFLTLFFICRQPKTFLNTMLRSKGLLCFVGYFALTVFWSNHKMVTLKEVSLLLLAFSFAVYLTCKLSLSRLLTFVVGANCVGAVTSLIIWWLFPHEAWGSTTTGADGTVVFGLRGSYLHKNYLGFAMNLSILSIFYLYSTSKVSGFLAFPIAFLFGWLLSCSNSATNYMAFGLVCGLWLLAFWGSTTSSRERTRLFFYALIGGFILVLFFVSNRNLVLTLLNRGDTFTGRTNIWRQVGVAIGNRPWFGYGFNSFWPTMSSLEQFPEATHISEKLNWTVPHAHNAYLDLVLSGGAVGLVLFLIFAWREIHKLLKGFFGREPDPKKVTATGFCLSFWALVIAVSFFESFSLYSRHLAILVWFYLVLSFDRLEEA